MVQELKPADYEARLQYAIRLQELAFAPCTEKV